MLEAALNVASKFSFLYNMNAKRFFALLQFLCLGGYLGIYCMPAYTKKISVVLEDGVAYIRLFGDEHNKRAENTDGYTVIQKNGVWYFAEEDSISGIKPSKHRLSLNTTEETRQFLETLPKHLSYKRGDVAKAMKKNQAHSMQRKSVVGTRKVLVILMQYSDLPMVKSQDDFHALFNSREYFEDGAQGSVCNFFTDVSYGQLQLTCDIIGPFTSKHESNYYGGNDRNGSDAHPEELFEEAINKAIDYVSLRDYDSDNDGFVDNIHIIFAGHGEEAGASDNAIWSHEATFYKAYEIQGVKIDRYSCAPELRGNKGNGISRIGPHCHEIGHALGAMDYYDTDYTINGEYMGTGDWDVMSSGSWNNDGITPADFNPYVKINDFGWVAPQIMPSGEICIQPSCDSPNQYYILKSPTSPDYYVFENRSKEKWGYGIPGEGMLIFHIHPEIVNSNNNINSASPQKCYVVCASSKTRRPSNTPTSYGDINSAGCPYPGSTNNTDFGQYSVPTAFFWDEDECGIELNHIHTDSEGNIHLENNSAGMGNDNKERETLFFENFEDDHIKIIIIDDNKGELAPTWGVQENPSSPPKVPTKPLAYKGTKCLQLSAMKTASVENSFSFSLPEASARSKGKLKIKLYVNTLNNREDSPNVIKVSYRTTDDTEWQSTEIQSIENNRWQQYVIGLPDNVSEEIQVTGTVYWGSILAIDNLEVEQIVEKEESTIREIEKPKNNIVMFYSPYGGKISRPGRGINIIKDKEGNIYKVLFQR